MSIRDTQSEFGIISGDGSGKERTERVNLGLALLGLVVVEGEGLSCSDIAAWCDCSSSAIREIEYNALKKLRNRLLFIKDPEIVELIQEMLLTA